MNAKGWVWIGVAVIVAGFWVASRFDGVSGDALPVATVPRQPGEGDIAQSAKALCRIAVPQAMNDPGSVEFVNEGQWPVTIGEDHRHVVRMTLRAKNAFNALILVEMDCLVEDRGTEWEAIRVTQVSP
jgi:hypothetical protein